MPPNAVPLPEGPPEAWQWVLRGGLTPEMASDDFGMRWHEPSRRVLIPVTRDGALLALVGRAVFGERPKYRMLGGPADTLFRLPTRPEKPVVVVEDILSAIAVWRAGANAVAVLGTAVSPVQAAQIASGGSVVVGWFDGDPAGDKAWATLRARMALHPIRLERVRTERDPKAIPRAELRAHLQSIGA